MNDLTLIKSFEKSNNLRRKNMLPTMNRQAFSKNIPQYLLSKESLTKVSLHGDLSDLWRS